MKSLILGLITEDAPEWLVIAIVGGIIVAFCVSFVYLHIRHNYDMEKLNSEYL